MNGGWAYNSSAGNWVGQLRNHVWFLARPRDSSLLQSIHTSSGAHTASC